MPSLCRYCPTEFSDEMEDEDQEEDEEAEEAGFRRHHSTRLHRPRPRPRHHPRHHSRAFTQRNYDVHIGRGGLGTKAPHDFGYSNQSPLGDEFEGTKEVADADFKDFTEDEMKDELAAYGEYKYDSNKVSVETDGQ